MVEVEVEMKMETLSYGHRGSAFSERPCHYV